MIRFIAEHKDHQVTDPATGGVGLVWGVEPMCAVLSEHGVKISPSTYYEWVNKKPTKRQLRDEEIVAAILQLRESNKLNKRLGSRKMWIKLRGAGHDVARCTVERLYRENGWEGARYGSQHRTTRPDEKHDRLPDLVDRDFAPVAPNRLWVADIQCRRRHWKSYADFRTMPTLPRIVQVGDGQQPGRSA